MAKCLRNCLGCSQHAPQVYNRVLSSSGRCCHIGFFRAGLAKPPEGVGVKVSGVKALRDPEFLSNMYGQGFYFYDLIDLKSNHHNICEHWRSTLCIFKEILEYYNDDMDHVLENLGQDVPSVLIEWLRNPIYEEKRYKPLHHVLQGEYTLPEVSDRVLDSYSSCQECEYFKREVGEDGSLNPYRGRCAQMGVSSGVWALDKDQDLPVTYSFLSCSNWKNVNPINVKEGVLKLHDRLRIFTETNPYLSVADLKKFYAYTPITRKKTLNEEDHKKMKATDLIMLLKSRHAEVKHSLFYKDFDFGFVSAFFGKSLNQSSKDSTNYWAQFQHYATVEEDLFGVQSVSDVTPIEELEILEEFDSQFSITNIKKELMEKVDAELEERRLKSLSYINEERGK